MDIRRRAERNAQILDIRGDISLLNARELRRALEAAIAAGPGVVAVNLENVPFIDSSGIGCLIAAYTDLNKSGRRLALVHVPETIIRTLEITNVIAFFPIYGSWEELFAAVP